MILKKIKERRLPTAFNQFVKMKLSYLITLIITVAILSPVDGKQNKSLNVFTGIGLERAQLAKIYKYLVKYWTALASIGHATIRAYYDLISHIGTFDLK